MFWFISLLIFVSSASSQKQDFVPTNAVERIIGDGYPLEVHDVTTDDGYILQVQRIPYSPLNGPDFAAKGVVFMQHGFIASSDDFIYNGPHTALAYMVSDAGYDVWLGNLRGNTYSKRHTTLKPFMSAFWNFAIDDHGISDVPAMIDYILKKTMMPSLHYVGHSMGTLAFFMMLSQRPEYNSKILSGNMLAPIAFLGNSRSGYLKILCPFIGQPKSELLGNFEILPHSHILGRIASELCNVYSPVLPLCAEIMNVFCGPSSNFNNSLYASVYASNPAGTSFKVAEQACQLYNSNSMRKFSYGPDKNYLVYGTQSPPDYNLQNIKVNLYLYHGNSDVFSDITDTEHLIQTIPDQIKGVTFYEDGLWAHNDFMFGNNVQTLVNPLVIERININNNN